MARITNEDCLVRVPNSFELITIASHRAREISTGAAPKIELKHENEKPTVIALREIASGIVDVNEVREYLIESKRASNTVANMLSKQAEEAEAEAMAEAMAERENFMNQENDDIANATATGSQSPEDVILTADK